jgi:hypothetical protein
MPGQSTAGCRPDRPWIPDRRSASGRVAPLAFQHDKPSSLAIARIRPSSSTTSRGRVLSPDEAARRPLSRPGRGPSHDRSSSARARSTSWIAPARRTDALIRHAFAHSKRCPLVVEEPDTREPTDGLPKPSPNLDIPRRKRAREGGLVASRQLSVAGRLGDDEDPTDGTSLPASLTRQQVGHDADLAVEGRQQLLEIDEARLDLDDEEGEATLPPSDDVDRASLPVVIEGVFDLRLPATTGKLGGSSFDEQCSAWSRSRCRSAPRQRGTRSTRMSSGAQIRSIVRRRSCRASPASMSETVV